MRAASLRSILMVSGVLLGITQAQGADQRNFWVLNNTGKVINGLFVSAHESRTWGEDTLGQARLPNGMGTFVYFSAYAKSSCSMDFKLVFTDGTEQVYGQGRNVCQLGAVQFNDGVSIGLPLP